MSTLSYPPGYVLLTVVVKLGMPQAIDLRSEIVAPFKPNKFSINVPSAGFGLLEQFTFEKINKPSVKILVGGKSDMFTWATVGMSFITLDMPLLQPREHIRLQGEYLGTVPEAYVKGTPYELRFSWTEPYAQEIKKGRQV